MITRRAFTTGAATMLAVGHVSTRARAATANWDMSTVWPDGNFHTQNAMAFAEEVKKQSGGTVNITVKAGGQLGFKGPEHLRAVRDGLVPLADVLNIQQVGDEPFMGVESIPFLAGSMDELKVLQKYVRPEYEKITARNNQKILYIVPWPTQYLHLKVKVSTVDGLKNIKIRVPDKNNVDMLNVVGMAPVLIPWGETIPALASGAVAGVSTSAVSGVDGKFWEFLKYVYPTNHVWSSQMVTVNLDSWKALSADQQQLVAGVAAKMEPDFWANALKADVDSLNRLKEGGMEVVPVPDAMMKEIRSKTEPLLEAFLKRVPAADKPVRAYLAELKR
ncbi:C4-dicarboxylate ABC transporter substrate-binding protein [Bradyrhizobium lablabi]|uniref:C4-dicarboxylate ABC transporter substrate-binding protein n=1 Tax=Bradyrhizobium lablabi TaxID=722472 RepID=A0A0R3MMV5_9BRAD|nr:TRAP transporter substrate-binding protein [Bradyrhizobium lablabi]KRR21556.1 C4-dicarboxylate ABC transporter substrate-binding protein [Bradyrhizobium lablabi]